MSSARDSILSLVIAIIILALAGLATVLYGPAGGNNNQAVNNNYLQKTKVVAEVALSGLGRLFGLKGSDQGKTADVSATAETGWQKFQTRFQEAWSPESADWSGTGLEIISGGLLHWKKTRDGAELIFTPKSGGIYTVAAPWRSISEMFTKSQ